MADTLLEPKLKSIDYYIDNLSLFMKGNYGVPEQVGMLVDVLNEVDNACTKVITMLDITKDEVFCDLVEYTDSTNPGVEVDLLTKIGNLYGISQHFTLSFINDDNERETHEVNLSPFEFWLLIKAQILQNCFDGSYAQTREYYDKMKLPVYIFTNADAATALIIFNDTVGISVADRNYQITNNIKYLFRANYFTIKSMGIEYSHLISALAYLGVWDDISQPWDDTNWGS